MSGGKNTCTMTVVLEQVRDTLSAAIDELAVPVDAGALADCVALLDRFTAKVLDGVGAFDAAEAWRDAGALNMTSWLRTAGCSRAQAHRLARTAKRLAGLPATAAAYRDGTLSTGQVQAIVANLSDQVAPLFADAEADLVPTLAAMPVPDVSATMQTWAEAARDSLTDPDPEPAVRRRLHLSRTLDGRRELSGSFDPEAGLLAETAFRVARTDDLDGEPQRSPAHRRADALVDVLRFYLDHQDTTPAGTRHRPHLNVFLDYEDLAHAAHAAPAATTATTATTGAATTGAAQPGAATTGADGPATRAAATEWPPVGPFARAATGWTAGGPVATAATGWTAGGHLARAATGWTADGTVLDAATILRLACDAGVNRVITQGRSAILDYGTTSRVVPAHLFQALVARDKHCRFGDCDVPADRCDADHVQHWGAGRTDRGRQPRPRLWGSPPPAPRTRLARQAPARRHLRGHRPRRPHHRAPTTGSTTRPPHPQPAAPPRTRPSTLGSRSAITDLRRRVVAGVLTDEAPPFGLAAHQRPAAT